MSAQPATYPPTLPPLTPRQLRYRHLCTLLCAQVTPPNDDGYTAADWDAYKAGLYAAEDQRLAR